MSDQKQVLLPCLRCRVRCSAVLRCQPSFFALLRSQAARSLGRRTVPNSRAPPCFSLQVVYLKPAEDFVSITEAAAVPWSPSSASQFPLSFQRQVQTMLLCHQRWQGGGHEQESDRVSLACCSRRLLATSLSGLRGLGQLGYKSPPVQPEEEPPSGACLLGCLPKVGELVVPAISVKACHAM